MYRAVTPPRLTLSGAMAVPPEVDLVKFWAPRDVHPDGSNTPRVLSFGVVIALLPGPEAASL